MATSLNYDLLVEGQEAFDLGRLAQARMLLKKSMQAGPTFDAAFLIALTYGKQGNLKMAARFFRDAVQISPHLPEGHYNLGRALQLLKDFSAARDAYQTAITLRQDYHEALHNLGVVHEELGEFDDAVLRLGQALKLQPDAAETHFSLGSIQRKLDQADDALSSLSRALEIDPHHVKALHNRGLVYLARQRYREALEDFGQAVLLEPEDEAHHFQKAQAAAYFKRIDVAAAAYKEVVRLNPEYADAWLNLGIALDQIKRHGEAITCFARFQKLRPEAPYVPGYLYYARMHICEWANYTSCAASIMDKVGRGEPAIIPHGLLLLPSSRVQQRQAAELWVKDKFVAVNPLPFPSAPRSGGDRIRLAYVSSDLHNHPVGILTAPVFDLHDRDRFEIFAFSLGIPSRDETRLRIENSVDHFINAREMSDAELVERARSEGIDIALDLNGYTAENRSAAFAMRLAPVQVNYLGYSSTMAAPFIDYIIADPVLIPPSHVDGYTENVVRLPDCYMPADPRRKVSTVSMTRAEAGLPEVGFVFCAFNNPYKISPSQFDLWMEILRSVPESVLWLSPSSLQGMENLRLEARRRGVDPVRLIFSKRVDKLSDHLARKCLADLFLDTVPHNAHATANDALCAGLPILTRLGDGFAGRVAGSLLSAIGMSDMIVSDEAEYVSRAIDIATTPGGSAKLKARLAANAEKSALFDTDLYVRNLERAFFRMHQCRMQGLSPAPFDVS